ncbi:E3 ubiquitin-protein ligase NEDD4-like [Hondaea fermentalgiana]|uniref:HECT-type E3 ubiquitin transferase n=1 Tax=Hondaea fermentalgiana TaxID=2315210 RepID=A0A2R5GI05_9STRA|nr:E3 ubiquitin-protein ligase NEDD4-like [Hondaea fermentalgiana]|eukprot:GBG30225.1 E3 ubiquitin-protein ligase NEDD4-like [Hondaea fermentalgiana]
MLTWLSGVLSRKRLSSGSLVSNSSKVRQDEGETDAATSALQTEAAERGAEFGVVLEGGDVVKQKVSVHYVVNNIYYAAPVRVSKLKAKRESYIWIELDERAVDRQANTGTADAAEWEKHKRSFPPGVSVNNIGNVKVGETGRKISGDDVWAAFEPPRRPRKPPRAEVHGANIIFVTICNVLGLVDYYEVQYMAVVPNHDAVILDPRLRTSREWDSLGHVSAASRQIDVENIQCGVQYIFRARAHNKLGWGPFSVPSEAVHTFPEAPSVPAPPFVQHPSGIRADRLVLQWTCPAARGSEIREFRVAGGALRDETVQDIFTGQALHLRLLNLAPSADYHFKVQAVNAVGPSPWSEYMTVRTKPPNTAVNATSATSAGVGAGVSAGFASSSQDGPGPGPYISDWVEVVRWDTYAPSYINIETGTETDDRPAAIDGPVDPIVEFKKKRFRFNAELLRKVPKGPANVLRLYIHRNSLLMDSMAKLMAVHDMEKLQMRIKVEYEGEEGIDAGGIAKDWFLRVSQLLFAEDSGLFVMSESEAGGYDVRLAPAAPDGGALESWFYFVGRVLGKAILDRQLVDVKLSGTLFKQILGMHVDIDDLRESDPALVKNMMWMLENDIDGILFEEFCVNVDPHPNAPVQEQVIVDLVPGGRNIEVTNENKEDYVEKMLKWRAVDSCRPHIEAIRRGLFEVVPEATLRAADFSLAELEMLWNGLPFIDVQQIRAGCVYQGGFDANSPAVHWFWTLFRDMDAADQALLLRFATGTSKVPMDGFTPPFNLTLNDQLDRHALCKAHACFNQVVLPDYATEAVLRDKVLFAIRNTDGFLLG